MVLSTVGSQGSRSSSKIIMYLDSQGSCICKDPNFGIHKDPGSEEPTKFQILEDMGLRKLMRVVDVKKQIIVIAVFRESCICIFTRSCSSWG